VERKKSARRKVPHDRSPRKNLNSKFGEEVIWKRPRREKGREYGRKGKSPQRISRKKINGAASRKETKGGKLKGRTGLEKRTVANFFRKEEEKKSRVKDAGKEAKR